MRVLRALALAVVLATALPAGAQASASAYSSPRWLLAHTQFDYFFGGIN